MAQVPVLGSAGGAIVDSFRLFPAAFRVGWPTLILLSLVSMGLLHIVTESGGRTEMVGWVLVPIIVFLFMPVYVSLIAHVAQGKPLPGWFSYVPGERALMTTVSLVVVALILTILYVILLAPMALAVTANLAKVFNEVVDDVEGAIGLFGLTEELWFIRDIPLQESPIGAGVLAALGLLAAVWLWIKSTFIVPHTALTGSFLPVWTSIRMTWGNFWSVFAASIIFASIMILIAPMVYVLLAYALSLLSLGGAFILQITGPGLLIGVAASCWGVWLMSAFAAFHGRLYRAAAGT